MAAIMVVGRKAIVPLNAMWCCAWPTLKVGPTRKPASSPARLAMVSGAMQSVPSSPFGPCCSVEPMGIRMAFDFVRYSSTSGQEERCSCINYVPIVCSFRAVLYVAEAGWRNSMWITIRGILITILSLIGLCAVATGIPAVLSGDQHALGWAAIGAYV